MLRGGAGADTLSGRGGGDTLAGGDGDDTLAGGSGRDALDGGAGSDRLVGGSGVDALTGGTGADRFVCQGLNDRGDIIADFTAAAQGDRLDLSALFGAGTPDTQAGLVAGGFVRLRDSAGGLQVLADADGGGDAFVAQATLAGVTTAGLGGAEILVA